MDNRRVYKKQNPRQARRSLAARVKGFFQGSLWRNSDAKPAPEPESAQKPAVTTPQKTSLDVARFTTPQGLAQTAERTPNAVLSDFFQNKGDKPLSEVEYEGVISLLSAQKSKTGVSGDTTPSVARKRVSGQKSALSTPNEQKVLRNSTESPRFATPEYRPAYHGAKVRNSGSVKRVYQFSGLPSPYRTKIRPIASPQVKKRPETPKDYKSINKAASTLLSVLDSDISKYSNPYKKRMTADTISKSFMFDKTIDDSSSSATTPTSVQVQGAVDVSEPEEAPVKVVEVPVKAPVEPEHVETSNSAESPASSETQEPAQVTAQPKASAQASAQAPASAPVPPAAQKPASAPVPAAKPEPSFAFSFTNTAASAPTIPAPSAAAATAPTFGFAASPAGQTEKSPASAVFQFPEVAARPVVLDAAAVESYKSLFSF